jgi:gas vesicle protein
MKDQHIDASRNGFLSGLLMGALLGAAAALWLAPQSGARTRQLVHRQAHQMQRTAERSLEDIKDGVQHTSEDIREVVTKVRHDN